MKKESHVLDRIFKTTKPVIGMVHLPPLPGSPSYDADGGIARIIDNALIDAVRLERGGIDGIQIENHWDRPYLGSAAVGPETVAAMTRAVDEIARTVSLPIGVNVHLNAAMHATAIAVATGCRWIRVFELAGAYVASTGLIEGIAPSLMRYRRSLNAESNVAVFGDFHVKHGSHQITADRALCEQLADVEEAGAECAIVTGLKTGDAPDTAMLAELRASVTIPLLVGSGFSAENAPDLLRNADGAIVGKALKREGVLSAKVDQERVSALMDVVHTVRTTRSKQ